MIITIEEIGTAPNSTGSQVFIDEKPFCFCIEDGYKEPKVPGRTRIPAGTYPVKPRRHGKFFQAYRRRFGHHFALEVEGIPNFSDVLIHIGNDADDTRGCPLVNNFIGMAKGEYVGTGSELAYLNLYAAVEPVLNAGGDVFLTIIRRPIIEEGEVPAG